MMRAWASLAVLQVLVIHLYTVTARLLSDFPPDLRLSTLTAHETTTFVHPSHPHKTVSIKSHKGWCEPDASSYSGYIDAGYGKELFFWFFESRGKPEEDDVVMWINGGPGGSSAMAMLLEQGPCRVKEGPNSLNDTYPNRYAWNTNANVFFVDQPIGVGFSHADHGQVVKRTEEAAIDIAAFIEIFFDTFKEYKGRGFHMSGESYGGRYLPVFASAVVDNNARMIREDKVPINLKSVMIGNGATSFYAMGVSSPSFMCTRHRDLGRALLPIKDCVEWMERIPRAAEGFTRYCLESLEPTMCRMWMAELEKSPPIDFSIYNVNQSCTPQEMEENLCMPENAKVEKYLNLPDVKALLGVTPHTPKYTLIDMKLNSDFYQAMDWSVQTYHYVANLLERGIKVLNYVGTLDAACDYKAQEMWMSEMSWSGRDGYLAAEAEDWVLDGEVVGDYKSYGPLTLLKVYGAGHMVPSDNDKPKEALAMLHAWIASTRSD